MARVVVFAPDGKRTFELSAFNTLGRHPDSTIQVLDPNASKEHCVIELRQGTFVVRDAGSLNGTFLNERELRGEAPLRHGDEIRVGDTRARFEDEEDTPLAAAPLPGIPVARLKLRKKSPSRRMPTAPRRSPSQPRRANTHPKNAPAPSAAREASPRTPIVTKPYPGTEKDTATPDTRPARIGPAIEAAPSAPARLQGAFAEPPPSKPGDDTWDLGPATPLVPATPRPAPPPPPEPRRHDALLADEVLRAASSPAASSMPIGSERFGHGHAPSHAPYDPAAALPPAPAVPKDWSGRPAGQTPPPTSPPSSAPPAPRYAVDPAVERNFPSFDRIAGDAARQRNDHLLLRSFYDVIRSLVIEGNATRMLEKLVEGTVRLLDVERGAAFGFDAQGALSPVAVHTRPGTPTAIAVSATLLGRVVNRREVAVTGPGGAPGRPALAVPLLFENDVHGVLYLEAASRPPVSPREMDVVAVIASHAALLMSMRGRAKGGGRAD